MPDIYWNQIKAIFAPYRYFMEQFTIATDEGVFAVILDDYQTVKRLHKVIAAALNGWSREADGNWTLPYKPTRERAMPPEEPLPVHQVDMFLSWVKDGMPEGPTMV